MPSFSASGGWWQRNNSMGNRDMIVDFGDGILANASNGDYDLNFITNQAEFNAYEPRLAKYLTDVVKNIPLNVKSIEAILADEYLILSIEPNNTWEPDYVRRADGAILTVQANPVPSLVQPHGELWRNLIINKSKHQIVVVDRLIKNDRHYAIVYILQSESKSSPYSRNTQYDITSPRNIQTVGIWLEGLMNTSIKALESRRE